jgi:FkbM family methyltransferase
MAAGLKLEKIHNSLCLLYGSFKEEFPEQFMVATYLRPDARVLELGGNIGRNSMVIASILDNDNNLVVVECDKGIARQLAENKERNGFGFHIVDKAISMRPLVNMGWNTKPQAAGDEDSGWKPVDTVRWADLTEMYGDFDTLVADCEGALYQILEDEPLFFRGFSMVIVENDYSDIAHKESVDSAMREAGLRNVFRQSGGWGPCKDFFFEVWIRDN